MQMVWQERVQSSSGADAEHIARYRFAETMQGSAVLDAACGIGYGTAILKASAGRDMVVGADISLEACRHAKQEYGIYVAVGDVSALPFKNDVFDLVVSFETVEHVATPAKLLSELFRTCKPGGALVVSTPNSAVYPRGNPFHVQEFTRKEIERLIMASGFEVVTIFGQWRVARTSRVNTVGVPHTSVLRVGIFLSRSVAVSRIHFLGSSLPHQLQ